MGNFCSADNQENKLLCRNAMIKGQLLETAISALKEIVEPITYMKKRLEPDERLNGQMAVQMANDPEYLKDIAKKTLRDL
jgi:hypothetical protein